MPPIDANHPAVDPAPLEPVAVDENPVSPDVGRAIDQLLDAQAPDWSTTAGLLIAHPAELEALRIVADVAAGWRRLQVAEDMSRPPPLFRWGALEVREKIASGASAEVFRASEAQTAAVVPRVRQLIFRDCDGLTIDVLGFVRVVVNQGANDAEQSHRRLS